VTAPPRPRVAGCTHVTTLLLGLAEARTMAYCRERLGSYKKPTAVRLSTDPLPRTPLGKISRKALREPYWAGRDQRLGAT
jgi:acyl-CoA synthetase (AMP-forming)/AMP-acid ligase II